MVLYDMYIFSISTKNSCPFFSTLHIAKSMSFEKYSQKYKKI
jgi:hypothetical protein